MKRLEGSRPSRLAALFALATCLCPAVARGYEAGDRIAEDESRPVLALLAGGAVTMASFGGAAAMVARGQTRTVRNGGLIGGQSAVVLAPLLAHAIVGEVRRGAWFALPLLLPVAMQSIVVSFYPNVLSRAPAGVQWTTYISVTASVFGGVLGVLDAARVGERRPRARTSPSLALVPMLGDGALGASLSGSL